MTSRAPGRRLIIWRHGQTTYNAEGRWQGQLDVPLSDLGRRQAQEKAQALLAYDIDAIWSSDLTRAASTAQSLADLVQLPITLDKRFREIDAGSWSGLTAAEVKEGYADLQARVEAGEDLPRGGNGETLTQVMQRSHEAALELLPTLPDGGTAVIATHGMCGRALIAALVGLTQQQAWLAFRGLSNCHWSAVVEGSHGWRIESWNAGAR